MTRYNYNRTTTPPAPFVHVTIFANDGSGRSSEWPAQLDCGADRTIIPVEVADELGLTPGGEFAAMGLGGAVILLPSFLVHLAIRQKAPISVVVAASPEEPYVLLGRDVLNNYRVLLDGPGLVLHID